MTSDIVNRINERLAVLSKTARAASIEATGKPDAIREIERGRQPSADRLSRIAQALKTSAAYLLKETDDPSPAQIPISEPAVKYRPEPTGHTEKIPVLGMGEGGEEGYSLWNGDVVDFVPRPPNLVGAPNAYAVYVTGSSMEPRYYPGELAFVHPGKPLTIGAHVLVQTRPLHEGDAPRAFIKRLVRQNGVKIVLAQYNPPRELEIQRRDIVSIHRIMASGE